MTLPESRSTSPGPAAPRKLKIAFIGARGVVGTYSGIETYYEEVGSRLAERGHEVTAYCRNYFTPAIPTHRGIRIRRLPAVRSKHLETISHSMLATLDSMRRNFDIIQYHAIGSAPLAWIPRVFGHATVVSVRGLDWQRAKWGLVARNALELQATLAGAMSVHDRPGFPAASADANPETQQSGVPIIDLSRWGSLEPFDAANRHLHPGHDYHLNSDRYHIGTTIPETM